MKGTFAKIIDRTFGAGLLFLVATAVIGYFQPQRIALIAGTIITALIYLASSLTSRISNDKQKLSHATEQMFYDFMFLNTDEPSKMLQVGLRKRGINCYTSKTALYYKNTVAFFAFDEVLTQTQTAKYISTAVRKGVSNVLIFSKKDFTPSISVDGITLRVISGNAVYQLFASLNALPAHTYKSTAKKRIFPFLSAALDLRKLPRYLLLSCAFFFIAAITKFSIMLTFCAILNAVLALSTIILRLINKTVTNKNTKNDANSTT